ncbi:hypothetical protein DWB77_07387 [Streptomyces hundungensis]|uniref:IgA FC receptor n=1 Tax=Streptomyces hundungensis TaxID=1077946 RepID=A0A387HSG9_9ACTN|nr:hypothetical protein [Streptomyces hundungensis]AYG85170.1 hypothetical protein DWB77_07387 [Streptomyces hundungensis]
MRIPRLPLVVLALLAGTGCAYITPESQAPARELAPHGGRMAPAAPSPFWPEPVQAPARETLAPAFGPASPTTPADTTAARPPRPLLGPGREPSQRTDTSGHRGRTPRLTRRPSPAPRPRPRAQPSYDARIVCSWAQNTGLDPSVVRACRQQLDH